jgi:glycosyltransferase involved in cell wall biosynthesis
MNSNTSSFLFIGRLSKEKGLDYLLDTFSANGLELRIGGDGPLIRQVTDTCRRADNIRYLGNLTREQVLREMRNCTALIFPSVWYETFGLVIIEAFSVGLPVIANKSGSVSSIITDSYDGLLFDAGNSSALQAKITEWRNKSVAERELFSRNARQTYTDNYTPEKNAVQLSSIYGTVINRRK